MLCSVARKQKRHIASCVGTVSETVRLPVVRRIIHSLWKPEAAETASVLWEREDGGATGRRYRFSGRDFPECSLGAAARVRAPASARRRGKGGEAIPQGCKTLYRQASKYAGFRLFVPSHGRLGKEPILRCFMRFPLSLPSFPCAQCIVLYPSEYRPGSLVFSPSAGAVHGLTAF